MNEQGRQILDMLAEGKITTDEAEQLIDALAPPQLQPAARRKPKYLRVLLIDNSAGDEPGGINVRIPLQLLRAGVRLTTLIPPVAITRVNAELEKAGVPIDLAELKPPQLEELIDHLDDVIVDIHDPDSKIQVFCE
jgi:hypothetical protein